MAPIIPGPVLVMELWSFRIGGKAHIVSTLMNRFGCRRGLRFRNTLLGSSVLVGAIFSNIASKPDMKILCARSSSWRGRPVSVFLWGWKSTRHHRRDVAMMGLCTRREATKKTGPLVWFSRWGSIPEGLGHEEEEQDATECNDNGNNPLLLLAEEKGRG